MLIHIAGDKRGGAGQFVCGKGEGYRCEQRWLDVVGFGSVMPLRYAASNARRSRIDKCIDSIGKNAVLVPVAGLEPARPFTVPGF